MGRLAFESSERLSGGTGRLEGVVQDLLTGAPLDGATVMIRPCSVRVGSTGYGPFLEWAPFFVTGAGGAFHLDGLPEGRFQVEARVDGYLPHCHSPLQELFNRAGRSKVFDILRSSEHCSGWDEAWNEEAAAEPHLQNQFPLVGAGQSVRIAVALRPGRVIAGHVRDSSAKPVAGATIKCIHQRVKVGFGWYEVNDLEPATTDADGAFRLTVYPDTDIGLLVTADRFASLHVSATPTQEVLELALVSASTIRGRVVRSDGRVAFRTRVVVLNPTDLETALTTDADERGEWAIDNAPPPPFAVLAWHGYSGGCWKVVAEPTSELNLVLRPLIAIRGCVVEPAGRPVVENFISQVFPFEWEGRTVQVNQTFRLDGGILGTSDMDGRFTAWVAPDESGKALLQFDYWSPPASVDGLGDVRLVVSGKMAEHLEMNRRFAHVQSEPESTRERPSPSCVLSKAPQPDLSPAAFESRNRLWIALLSTEPPSERIALLQKLGLEISGGG